MTQGGPGEKINSTLNVLFYFSDLCRYFTNHLLENIHIWATGTCTIHGKLPLDSFRHLGPCLRMVPQRILQYLHTCTFFWVQNFEFQYFWGFQKRLILFGGMKILWIFFLVIAKLGYFWEPYLCILESFLNCLRHLGTCHKLF